MADNNPFDTPLQSETQDHQQAQAATVQASDNGNPFAEPLMSEKVEAQHKATFGSDPTGRQMSEDAGGAAIPPVTPATNPKLAAAMPGVDMPMHVGAVGTAAAGAELLGEGAAPALRYMAHEWGAPAVTALEEAAKSHPLVAKIIAHGLADASLMGVAKYMKLFGK
jgi:hypothetical protein